ncbi:hypothetical protein CLAIMM_07321 [Cladophialophora immunda]|nr:hypothetical protein CLAIMM_07321 [Cladophialophora immunda]
MSPTKAPAGPLAERSPNPTSPAKSKSETGDNNNKINKLALADAGVDAHRVVVAMPMTMPRFEHPQQRGGAMLAQNQTTGSQTYISPSDAIRSPTTKKLSEIKGRRFMSAKPQTLFAKTLAKENLKAQAQGQDQVQH